MNLKDKKVAIIGCGGLGCNVAVHICGMGVGNIVLCDFDVVGESNLNRQFLYNHSDTGKPKTEIAAEKLRAYNPSITITCVNKKIVSADDLCFADDCDLIFLAVDNNEARQTANEYCHKKEIALVNGGINGFFGTVYMYVPKMSPCLKCAGLTEKSNGKIVSISSTAGIIGSLEAEIGVKYLLDKHTRVSGVLHIYDNCELTKIKIQKCADCEICRAERIGP